MLKSHDAEAGCSRLPATDATSASYRHLWPGSDLGSLACLIVKGFQLIARALTLYRARERKREARGCEVDGVSVGRRADVRSGDLRNTFRRPGPTILACCTGLL